MVDPEDISSIQTEADTALRLQTIAALLDLPIDRFFDSASPQSHRDVMELLGLWQKLGTDEDRAAVLIYLRTVSAGRSS